MEFIKKGLGAILLAGFAALLASVLLAFPVQFLWNNILVEVLCVKEITIWQALGIYILCMILFKNSNQKESKD